MRESDEMNHQAEQEDAAGHGLESVHVEDTKQGAQLGGRPEHFWLASFVVALTVGSLLYRSLVREDLTHSAAMFLGVPAVLAILLAFTPKAKSLTGGIVKGITLFLLVMAPLLGEGYLCILIASPIFYLVGIIVGLLADSQRKRRKATLSCVAIVLLPMCLEGIVPQLTLSRDQSVDHGRGQRSGSGRGGRTSAKPRSANSAASVAQDRLSAAVGGLRQRPCRWSDAHDSLCRRGGRPAG